MNKNTVACLIIGDEVLGGKTKDTNSQFLASLCFDAGLSLKRIVVVPDETDAIVEAAVSLSEKYNHVITSGGIGPTHDDITYDSIAKAFNLSMKRHEPTISLMEKISRARDPTTSFVLNEGRVRMATLPYPAAITYPCQHFWVPVVTVNSNVSIFPGIPRLFQELVSNFIHNTIVPSNPELKQFIRKSIGTMKMESEIAAVLTRWQAEVDPIGIKIGSYPKLIPETILDAEGIEQSVRVLVTVVGQDAEAVERIISGIQTDLGAFRCI